MLCIRIQFNLINDALLYGFCADVVTRCGRECVLE